MITEYIRYNIPSASAEAFVSAYVQAAESLRASEHCLGYELSRCTEDPEQFILRIQWDSTEGHLAGFRKSPQFSSFFAAIKPYVAQIQEMRHYAVELRWSRS